MIEKKIIIDIPNPHNRHEECSITIVYDNVSTNKELIADWGFGCIVKYGDNTILFDTGAKGEILTKNLITIYGNVSILHNASAVLSHDHYDHVGGVSSITSIFSNTCFIPNSSSDELRNTITSSSGKFVSIEGMAEIYPNVWSSGKLSGSMHEQALVLKIHEKLIILTGCAHPGIVEITKHVISLFKEPVYMVLGGFHWYETPIEAVKNSVKQLQDLGVKKIAPCHCTGTSAISWIRDTLKDDFIDIGVGTRLVF